MTVPSLPRSPAPALAFALALLLGGLRDPAMAAVFTIVLWGWLIAAEGGADFPKGGLWSGLAFWSLLSALMNPQAGPEAVSVSARWFLAAAFFAWVRSVPRPGVFLAPALLAASAAGALKVLYDQFSGGPLIGILPPNPNYTAALVGAGLLRLVSGRRPAGRAAMAGSLALGAVLASALVLLNSRGAAVAAWAALSWLLLSSGRRRAGLAALLSPAVLLFLPDGAARGFLKLDDPNAYRRIDIWKAALAAFLERPAAGWGPGSFGAAFETFKFPAFNGISWFGHHTPHAHSEPLNLLAEYGLPGAALYLAAFRDGFRRAAAGPWAAPALFLFVHSLFDGIFYAWGLLLLLLACLASGEAGAEPVAPERTFSRALPALAAAGLAALAWQGIHRQSLAVSCALKEKEPRVRAACALRAADRAPRDEALRLALAEAMAAWSGSSAAGAAAAEAGLEALPRSAFLNFRAAGFYVSSGAPRRAEEKLRRALYLEPNFVAARLALAELLDKAGRRASAAAEREAAAAASALVPAARSGYDRRLTEDGRKIWKKTGAATASGRN